MVWSAALRAWVCRLISLRDMADVARPQHVERLAAGAPGAARTAEFKHALAIGGGHDDLEGLAGLAQMAESSVERRCVAGRQGVLDILQPVAAVWSRAGRRRPVKRRGCRRGSSRTMRRARLPGRPPADPPALADPPSGGHGGGRGGSATRSPPDRLRQGRRAPARSDQGGGGPARRGHGGGSLSLA